MIHTSFIMTFFKFKEFLIIIEDSLGEQWMEELLDAKFTS